MMLILGRLSSDCSTFLKTIKLLEVAKDPDAPGASGRTRIEGVRLPGWTASVSSCCRLTFLRRRLFLNRLFLNRLFSYGLLLHGLFRLFARLRGDLCLMVSLGFHVTRSCRYLNVPVGMTSDRTTLEQCHRATRVPLWSPWIFPRS